MAVEIAQEYAFEIANEDEEKVMHKSHWVLTFVSCLYCYKCIALTMEMSSIIKYGSIFEMTLRRF